MSVSAYNGNNETGVNNARITPTRTNGCSFSKEVFDFLGQLEIKRPVIIYVEGGWGGGGREKYIGEIKISVSPPPPPPPPPGQVISK